MKFFIKYLLILLILAGCKNETDYNSKIITIPVDPTKSENIKISDIFKNAHFFSLQTDTSVMIGRFNNMKCVNNKIYLSDNKRLYIFNKEGELLNKIGKIGKGPEEYISITTFQVDDRDDIIYVLDYKGKKVVSYDYNGKFISSWDINIYSFDFCKIDNNNFCFYSGYHPNSNSNNTINVLQKNDKTIIEKYFPIDDNMAWYYYIMQARSFYKYNDSCFYLHDPFDTIYHIKNTKVQASIVLDFGKYKLPQKVIFNKYDDVVDYTNDVNKKGYVHHVNHFIENDLLIFFMFQYKGEKYHVYYDKLNNQVKVTQKLIGDIKFANHKIKVDYDITPMAYDNSNFYYLVEPYFFISTLEEIKDNIGNEKWENYLNNNPDIKKLYKDIKIDDNPIIGVYSFKYPYNK